MKLDNPRFKIEAIKNDYINGNKADFREELKTLNAKETAILIANWQPHHNAIAIIKNSWEIIEREEK